MPKLIPIEGKQNEHLYRDPRTEKIYFREFREGKGEVCKSLRTTNTIEARVKRDEIRLEWLGLKPKKKTVKLFQELWADFLDTKKTKSKNHYDTIESRGRLHILPFFNDWYVTDINEETGKVYAGAQWEKTPGRKLFNDIKAINMFLTYCFNVGAIPKKIAFEYPDPPTEAGKVYSDEEVERLLKNTKGDMHLMVLMAYTMGMRRGEIENLTWDRVDMEKRVIHLRAQDTKIREPRSFGISRVVYEHLQMKALIKNDLLDGEVTHVFNNPNDPRKPLGRNGHRKAWSAAKKLSKVSGRFHDLRHSFLTKAFKNSVNPALICEYAGLSLREAQKTYLHFTVEDTRVVSKLVDLDSSLIGLDGNNSFGINSEKTHND